MAIQKVPTEVNAFVKGLVTEASPLTFPENASLDERNFVLKRDGSRSRRLGMDKISEVFEIPTETEEGKVYSAFEWKNAGGVPDNLFIVVQYGKDLMIFDFTSTVPELIKTFDLKVELSSAKLDLEKGSFASVDGILVGVFGEHDILRVTYSEETFVADTVNLKIRDQFGIQVNYERPEKTITFSDGSPDKFYPYRFIEDMLEDEAVNVRPFREQPPDLHFYNLRNQSWGRARKAVVPPATAIRNLDPLKEFDDRYGLYPSNADVVATGLINFSEESGAPVRFVAEELGDSPQSSSSAARGFFVIDALRRGPSRREQHDLMFEEAAGDLEVPLTAPLRADTTPDGARCVAEFAGRVWYSGFTGSTITPDTRSPRMSSYVLFSQLVTTPSNINKCYQKNDPTYEEEADLLATDGGLLRLDEAYGIQHMVAIGESLLVLATNGVWAISGGSDRGFAADAYIVEKVTDQGVLATGNIVNDGNTVYYWANSGIFVITPNDNGVYVEQSLTENTIQSFYEEIPSTSKRNASGAFDRFENKIKWTYSSGLITGQSKELVLDLTLKAFYPNDHSVLEGQTPTVLSPITVRPFSFSTAKQPVFSNGEEVLLGSSTDTLYIALWGTSPLTLAFTSYKDTRFKDWSSKDAVGADATAYAITGYMPQGEFQRRKQVSRLTSYMTKTEDGFEEREGDLIPVNASSCLMQARWDWSNSPNGNRWGRENQIYKNKRVYMPEDIHDAYDDGESVITTKTKLRGHGKTLSLLFKTEPEKDCKLLGWSMVTDVSTNV